MTEPATNETLLARVRDPQDREAWAEFVSIYRPLLYRVGRRYGLQDVDAQNLVQDVLQKVTRQVEQWESGKPAGGLRRWLATVARHAAIDAIRRVRPDAAQGGTSVQKRLQDLRERPDSSEAELQRELDRQAFRWAAARIRDEFTDSTWSAFWQTMVEGESCSEVAESAGRTLGSVYTARSRVMQRLKEEVNHFDWTSAEEDRHAEDGQATTGDHSTSTGGER
ncbi:MAG: RNA polymerase sigma-70 factor (ECF subfamily) [Planctomycetaceae bacterium]|jgi:RNA polymerase sigma-70 factor (ECF subfamily)